MDAEWRDVQIPAFPQSIRLQPRTEPLERRPTSRSSRDQKIAGLPKPRPSLRLEPGTSLLPAGEALISWVTPRDAGPAGTLGFFATLDGTALPRELIPLAGAPGHTSRDAPSRPENLGHGSEHKLSVRAVDAAGNRGPEARSADFVSRTERPLTCLNSSRPRRQPSRVAALPRVAGADVAIIDELDKVNPSTGELIPGAARRLSDRQPSLGCRGSTDQAPGSSERVRRVSGHAARRRSGRGDQADAGLRRARPARRSKSRWGAIIPSLSRAGPMPDPIVPLGFAAENTPRTKYQSLHVEVYIPHELPPGEYPGILELNGLRTDPEIHLRLIEQTLRLPVSLRVWDFTLPDHLSFLPEMNCYGLPEDELDYYRLAHRHRTVLNRVPYNQAGRMQDGCAPLWDKARLKLDWSRWDRRFGPLLDGSAFADLPRKGVPVECFYLPLHENWPSPMEGNYNGDYWADRAFPDSYRQAFVAASRQIAAHLADKHWNETLFQGFLNNKNNFKANGWSRGSSPWLLDEPASFQDFWALRYFARAFHEGINQATKEPARASVSFAAIGVPRRHLSPAVASGTAWTAFSTITWSEVQCAIIRGLVFERKRTLGEIVLEYGSNNPVEGSNVQPAALVPGRLVDGYRRSHSLADRRNFRLLESRRRARALLSAPRRCPARPVRAGQNNRRRFRRSGSSLIAAASKTSST